MATPKRFSGPQFLTNAPVTQYTCPESTIAVIKRMRVSNPSGGAINFKLSLGADAANTRLYDVDIPANGSLDVFGPFTLEDGQIVQAYAGTTNTLVLEIDGSEQPAPA